MVNYIALPDKFQKHDLRNTQSRVIKSIAFIDSSIDLNLFSGYDSANWQSLIDNNRIIVAEGVKGTWPETVNPIATSSDGYEQSIPDSYGFGIGVSDYNPNENDVFWSRLEWQSRQRQWSTIIIFEDKTGYYPYNGDGLIPITVSPSNGVIGKSIVKNVRLTWSGSLLGILSDLPNSIFNSEKLC